jgi:1-hydroxycarotenoid 3,4-desaturase
MAKCQYLLTVVKTEPIDGGTCVKVVIIGAGIGGLVAALRLAAAGIDVTVLEQHQRPGGKMRRVPVGGTAVDAGPTVFTMRWVFEEIFAECGADLAAHVALEPAAILARHAWGPGEVLDLHADPEASEAAIGNFAGPHERDGYRRFRARAAEVYATLEGPFIRGERPSPIDLTRRAGLLGMGDLWRIQPFTTLWRALGDYFADPRLRQLFGRYATYCGSSPFAAPATLMLVAHVESQGVWHVAGGLSRLAGAVAELAAERGAGFRYGTPARGIAVQGGRVVGVDLADGERLPADAVVCNADVAALADGFLGRDAARAADTVPAADRSLSAVTLCLQARAEGFPLSRHTVFFSGDYAAEFARIRAGHLPDDPTVYVCAQDRGDTPSPSARPERLLCLVNAPARTFTPSEIETCVTTMRRRLSTSGLTLSETAEPVTTGPAEFARLFPGSAGALYGRASHGWMASFKRPGARTRIPGLYLAGGSVHPGPGVPMAAQSGRIAADSLLRDRNGARASIRGWIATATSGGTSTP